MDKRPAVIENLSVRIGQVLRVQTQFPKELITKFENQLAVQEELKKLK